MSEVKYYTLDELKVGMRVSVLSLAKILGTRIVLDRKTYKKELDDIGRGTILYIGNGDYSKQGINRNDVITIYNGYDSVDYDNF